MGFKAYHYRYGVHENFNCKSKKEAIERVKAQEDMGECFGDCVVDENGIIVYDFDAENEVFGREQPNSRVGNKF